MLQALTAERDELQRRLAAVPQLEAEAADARAGNRAKDSLLDACWVQVGGDVPCFSLLLFRCVPSCVLF